MAEPEVRAAGLIVFRREGEGIVYLLLKASYQPHHWTPPKGHVDDGETDLEAAYRETEEEAGIGRDSLRRLDNFTTELKYRVNRGRLKKVTFWLAESSTDRVVLSSESRTHKWACLKEACQLARFPEMVQALEDAEKFLKP